MKRVLIITPAAAGSRSGNRVTAERWQRLLREMGYDVEVAEAFEDQQADVCIALHARRSAPSISAWRERRPGQALIVVLTGTDLYQDIHTDRDARASLDAATRLVVLQEKGLEELPQQLRARAHVIVQSVAAPAGIGGVSPTATSGFDVCVLGHLRAVKDPMRAALAARQLPPDSRVRIIHVGAAEDEAMRAQARAEEAANPRYSWRGGVERAEALALLAACQLHVLSSRSEGGANALCEALAYGVPSLCSRIPGSIGLLGEDYPGYFTYGATDELTALMARCEADGEFYERLVDWTRARAVLVEPQRERAALERLLQDVLAG